MLAYAFIDDFLCGMTCDCESYNILYMNLRSGIILSYWSGRVGSGRVGSGRVGSGRVGSGRVGSGRVGSDWVGSGQVRYYTFFPHYYLITPF